MLKVLRSIVQEVNAAQDLEAALTVVVRRLKESVEADASNIFLIDDDTHEYFLAATDGFDVKRMPQVRLNVGEGLIGLVGEREEPINIEDAPSHPRFLAHKGLIEEGFFSFLGVPMMYQRALQGVITVHRQQIQHFDEAEEAFLATLATQLAAAIAHAKATGGLVDYGKKKQRRKVKNAVFTGVSGAPGVGIGQGVVVYPLADLQAVPFREVEDTQAELQAFEQALEAVRNEIRQLGETMAHQLASEDKMLFDAYLQMLESESLIGDVTQEINNKQWAQGAVRRVITRHILQFEGMEDSYLQERATDVRDLGQRILFQLQSGNKRKIEYPEKTILVGEQVTPAALADVPEERLAGIVSVSGSANSHIAILARALGVPTVMGAVGIKVTDFENQEIIIDGYYGQVYLSPKAAVHKEFRGLLREEQELDAELEELREMPAETTDNYGISLYVNTGLVADIGRALSVGAEGVGLYRTEVPFMVRDRFPSEEEQRVIYRQLLNAFAPRPVIMRSLDVGGDKMLSYFPVEEDNPFLGWRGIRITLDQPEIFLVQARAMLHASEGLDNLHIMLPMITSVNEVEAAVRLLNQAHAELAEEGVSVKMPAVGVMVEVPSAVYQVREIARRVDFMSVGSNDLTQYLLAVDRNNARVGSLYDALHPAVLRALIDVVKGAHKEHKHVSICGEMAGDPVSVVLLLAIGFDTLSMSATNLPRVKWVIRNFSMSQARSLLDDVLMMDDPVEIRCHMEGALDEVGLGGLIRAGRS